MSLRSAFAATLSGIMDDDPEVILVLGDISTWAFRHVSERHPKRVLNLGVAEQGSLSFCAGLGMGGFYPVYHTIDSFLRRAYEQAYLDFGIQRVPGLLLTVGGTSDYAKLGPTHCAPEMPTLMAQIPGMHIRMPITEATVDLAIRSAVEKRQLSYIRLEESLAVADGDQSPRPRLHLKLGASNGHAIDPGAQR